MSVKMGENSSLLSKLKTKLTGGDRPDSPQRPDSTR